MDIDRVRYFNAVVETGSLVKASEILHISQPALSKALRVLESEVGTKLLEPDGRGLRVTEAGKRFHRQAGPLLNQWLELPRRLQGDAKTAPVRIGSFEVFTTYFLGRAAEELDLRHLEVHELGPGELERAVADGKLDFGITYHPVPLQGVDFVEVTKIKMGLFGRRAAFSGAEFADLPFVIPLFPAEGTPSKMVGLDGWPDHRYGRRVEYRVTLMESALALCRRGLAVAYLPEFIVNLHNEFAKPDYSLVERDCPVPKRERLQSVFLVQRKGADESALFRKMAKALRALK